MSTTWSNIAKRLITSILNIFNKSGTPFNQSGTLFGGTNSPTSWTFTNRS